MDLRFSPDHEDVKNRAERKRDSGSIGDDRDASCFVQIGRSFFTSY